MARGKSVEVRLNVELKLGGRTGPSDTSEPATLSLSPEQKVKITAGEGHLLFEVEQNPMFYFPVPVQAVFGLTNRLPTIRQKAEAEAWITNNSSLPSELQTALVGLMYANEFP